MGFENETYGDGRPMPQNAWLHQDGSLTAVRHHDDGGGYAANGDRGSVRIVSIPEQQLVVDPSGSRRSAPLTDRQIDSIRQIYAQTKAPTLVVEGPNAYWDRSKAGFRDIPTREVEGVLREYNDAMPNREKQAKATVVIAKDSPHYKTRTAKDVGVMPEPAALALVRAKDATGRRILDKGVSIMDGQPVGVRANLNVKKSTGVTVQTIHQGSTAQLTKGTGMYSGEAIGYGAAVTLRDVNMSVNQEARAKIVSGEKNKFPMASVDGKYVDIGTPWKDFDGVELRFNPMKQHLFVDPDGRAVKSASEATVVGSSVFVRGTITYYTPANMPKPARGLQSEVVN